MSSEVEQAWHEVCVDPIGGLNTLAMNIVNLPLEKLQSIESIGPHLKLQKHVFHEVTWTQLKS